MTPALEETPTAESGQCPDHEGPEQIQQEGKEDQHDEQADPLPDGLGQQHRLKEPARVQTGRLRAV